MHVILENDANPFSQFDRIEHTDISELARDITRQLEPQFQQANTPLQVKIEPAIAAKDWSAAAVAALGVLALRLLALLPKMAYELRMAQKFCEGL